MKQLTPLFLRILFIFFISLKLSAQTNIYVAVDGDDSNTGSISAPLKTLQGARDKVRTLISSGVPSGGVIVNFRGGRYTITSKVDLGASDSGTSGNPIVYQGYQSEEVIFDGTEFVSNSAFQLETDTSILHSSAVGKVYVQTLTDTNIIDVIKDSESAQMSMDDQMMTLARFPNIGFGTMNASSIDHSTEVVRTEGTLLDPKGAKFKLIESFDATKWNAELASNTTGDVYVRGYMSADWFKGTLTVNTVATDGEIHLQEGSNYGIEDRTGGEGPNRLYVAHLLCELDEPGEWYFNQTTNKLYIYPYSEITSNSKIGVWSGPQLVEVNNGSHIQFKNMKIQGIGSGVGGDAALNFKSGSDFLVAGVTFRYIATPVLAVNFLADVVNSTVQSCDFFDIPNSTRLYGGSFTSTGTITVGNNKIENSHFTQIYSKDFAGKATGILGVGNIFRNNLVHNENIQPITHGGIDHLIELNEIFNVGIEEGDGGAIYTGADIMSYGNVLKHNFVHHIMCVPTLLGRASMFSDDLDGGDQMLENVTYKGGWEVLKMNTGAGHTVQHNVVLDGFKGIRQSKGGTTVYNTSMEYINSTNGKLPSSGDKNNYMGRMLQKIGISNWDVGVDETNWYDRIEPFWQTRYPTFDNVMKAYSDNDQMNGYECKYYYNMFWSCDQDVELAGDTDAEVLGSQAIDLTIFENPDNLNFKFIEPRPSYTTDIPFENIGLYSDSYRCAVPDKDAYRRAIKQRFEGQASYTSDSYNSATINDRLYYNTGKLVYSSVPCQDVFRQTSFYLDFGTQTSTRFSGYERVSEATLMGNGVHGWLDVTGLSSADRSGSGANDLNKDFVAGSTAKTYAFKVPNGVYNVLINLGDISNTLNDMSVNAEGITYLSDIDQAAGTAANRIFDVRVSDGQLDIEFSGNNPNWAVTRVVVTKKSAQSEFNLDFGTSTSPLYTGYERVTETATTTTGSFYGWTDTTGLTSVDRTTGGANDLNRDFVTGTTAKTFEIELPNNTYTLVFNLGDADTNHNDVTVKAEGVTIIDNIDELASTFTSRVFRDIVVSDGKLELEFSGSTPAWSITRLLVKPTIEQTEFQLDFGTQTSPLLTDYERVSEITSMDDGGFIGWNDLTSLNSVDRGSGSGADDANRDIIFSSATRTLELILPNDTYTLEIDLGDVCCQHDNITVKAEGVIKIDNVTVPANTFNTYTFDDIVVSDGKLELEFSDGGGTDANWTVTRAIIKPTPPVQTEFKLDFGTTTSPVMTGYERVSENTSSSNGLYGWTDLTSVQSVDRGTGSDDLKRDLVYSSAIRTFEISVPNDTYTLEINLGDVCCQHDNITVKAEGVTKIDDVSISANTFDTYTFNDVEVTDGKLELEFSDGGGVDPNWTVTSVVVKPAPAPQTEFKLDFGTTTSPVLTGYEKVSNDTSANDGLFGWTNLTGINTVDRGSGTGADDAQRDLVFSSITSTFEISIPNDTYTLEIEMGDTCCQHDNITVKAEGVIKVDNVNLTANNFNVYTFNDIVVSDGKLELEFSDGGGSDVNWVVNRVLVKPTPQTTFNLDFGSSSSPVISGYEKVTETTTIASQGTYGWASTSDLSATDRGAINGANDFTRDFISSDQPKVFEVTIPNDDYQVTITAADVSGANHNDIQIKAEGIIKEIDIDAFGGIVVERTFTVTVSDGQLDLEFIGTNPDWVLCGLSIQPDSGVLNQIPVAHLSDFQVYPNPATDHINVRVQNLSDLNKNKTLFVYDFVGNVVLTKIIQQEFNSIDISNLKSGIYLIELPFENNPKRIKLIKK